MQEEIRRGVIRSVHSTECAGSNPICGAPPSSRGQGRHPFKVETRGSNPLGGTILLRDKGMVSDSTVFMFSDLSITTILNML